MKAYFSNFHYSVMNSSTCGLIAIYVIYLKYKDVYLKYFKIIQNIKYGNNSISQIRNLIDIFYFFSKDAFIILLMSFIYILSHKFIKLKLITFIQIIISVIIIFILYANQNSFGTVGQYLNYSSAVVAASYAFEAPKTASTYFNYNSFSIFLCLIMTAISLTLLNRRLSELNIFKKLAIPVYAAMVFFLSSVIVLGSFSKIGAYPIENGYLQMSFHTILPNASEESDAPYDQHQINQSARINFGNNPDPQPLPNDIQLNKAVKNDLIVFVLETAAERFMPLQEHLKDYPTLSLLSSHSIIALQHYSTFPASSEAFSSILFGNYAPRNYYQTCLLTDPSLGNGFIPGLVAEMAQAGMKTALYMPYKSNVPLDIMLHAKSGFDKIYYANSYQRIAGKSRDEQALAEMLSDIDAWTTKKQRYATFILPQIGHAPWPARDKNTSVEEYGRKLTIAQDKWLNSIVELLRKKGRLSNTTIVVTGDHGIRTSLEDSDFVPGKIDEYSFHVPLFIYSPQFTDKRYIDFPTSHVDIAPSLEILLGLKSDKTQYQGIPIWEAKNRKRDIFFSANWYFGADGFLSKNQFYMWSNPLGIAFENDKLKFFNKNIVTDKNITLMVRNKIRSFYKTQQERVDSVCSGYFHKKTNELANNAT